MPFIFYRYDIIFPSSYDYESFRYRGLLVKGVKAGQFYSQYEMSSSHIDNSRSFSDLQLRGDHNATINKVPLKDRIYNIVCSLEKVREEIEKEVIPHATVFRYENAAIFSIAKDIHAEIITTIIRAHRLEEKLLHAALAGQYIYSHTQNIEHQIDQIVILYTQLKEAFVDVKQKLTHTYHTITTSILHFFKILDNIPILSQKNLLRTHELQVIKAARDTLKAYCRSISHPPGPATSLHAVWSQIQQLIHIANTFYHEGKEIEKMQRRLQKLYERVMHMSNYYNENYQIFLAKGDIPDTIEDSFLKDIIKKILFLHKNVAIIGDRNSHYDQITTELMLYKKEG